MHRNGWWIPSTDFSTKKAHIHKDERTHIHLFYRFGYNASLAHLPTDFRRVLRSGFLSRGDTGAFQPVSSVLCCSDRDILFFVSANYDLVSQCNGLKRFRQGEIRDFWVFLAPKENTHTAHVEGKTTSTIYDASTKYDEQKKKEKGEHDETTFL